MSCVTVDIEAVAVARASFWRAVAVDLASDAPRTMAALRSMAAGDVGGMAGFGAPASPWPMLAVWRDAGPVPLAELVAFVLEVPA